jgi:uncharacterized membrane protein
MECLPMSENKKNSFKRFLLIYLIALVGVAILLTMIAVFDKQDVSTTLTEF